MAAETARVQPFQLPARGSMYVDTRGSDRALRVSWHPSDGLVTLSLWRGGTCAGSFRLARDEVPDLIGLLARGLADDAGVEASAGSGKSLGETRSA